MYSLSEAIMRIHLKECFEKYGIEGTEQKIKELYEDNSVIQTRYLEVFRKVLSDWKL